MENTTKQIDITPAIYILVMVLVFVLGTAVQVPNPLGGEAANGYDGCDALKLLITF